MTQTATERFARLTGERKRELVTGFADIRRALLEQLSEQSGIKWPSPKYRENPVGFMREILGVVYDRSPSLASANNHFLLGGSDIERARLAEISVPTLVVHGTHDPLFPGHGEVLAREIPGAQLVVIDGLGHEFPRWAWREMLRRRSGRRAGQARRPEC